LFPEKCIAAHLDLARRLGAVLQFDEAVLSWQINGDGVRVVTVKKHYLANRLLITAGAWLTQLVQDLRLPLTCARQTLFWFKPKAHLDYFHPSRCPIFLLEYDADRIFYGFPEMGQGVKAAIHHEGALTNPDDLQRCVDPAESSDLRTLLRRFIPDAEGELCNAIVCMYTNTPDSHFLIDYHPQYPQVLIASPCSGHGFKFSSAIGEILADLLIKGQTEFDLSPFNLARLQPASS
jgi:sarcosine oxidase